MCFGAAMEKAGVLERWCECWWFLRTVGGLIATTVATCLGVNTLAADQYIAIVLPGGCSKTPTATRSASKEPLAHTRRRRDHHLAADPWNTCGAYMAATLGVPTLAYLPFCFFNLINPVHGHRSMAI